jgi:hypothetical protein
MMADILTKIEPTSATRSPPPSARDAERALERRAKRLRRRAVSAAIERKLAGGLRR